MRSVGQKARENHAGHLEDMGQFSPKNHDFSGLYFLILALESKVCFTPYHLVHIVGHVTAYWEL